MRKFGCMGILIVLIMAVLVWQQWQIQQLKSSSQAIASKFSGAKGDKPDLTAALAQAESYTKKAKELIAEKKLTQAQAELDSALKSLRSANSVSSDIVGEAADMMGKAKDDLVRTFQKAWNDISEEAKPKEKK